jgi:hypothetical protein
MKKLIYVGLILIFGISVFAQNGRQQPDREKIQAARIAFLTNRLELSVSQAKVFWPIFTEYDSKKGTMLKEYSEKKRILFDRNEERNLSDEDSKKMLDFYLEQKQAELDLEKSYLQKFNAVLDAKQVWKVITFDSDFRRSLMRRISDDGDGEGRDNRKGNK